MIHIDNLVDRFFMIVLSDFLEGAEVVFGVQVWWYWLVIDLASILIYWSRDLQLSSFLFLIYVIMIPFGLLSWTRSMHQLADNSDDRSQ